MQIGYKRLMNAVVFLLFLSVTACKVDLGSAGVRTADDEISQDSLGDDADGVAPLETDGGVLIRDFRGLEDYLKTREEKVLVVNFWATWCKPCVEELPHFEALEDRYADQGVKVVLVSLDFPNKAEEQLLPFIDRNNVKSQVVLLNDPKQNTWIPKVDPEWSGAIPATLIIQGVNRRFYEKSFNFEELEGVVKTMIP